MSTQERKPAKASSGAANDVKTAAANAASTLIEFPGVPPKPQWRKELSERVREIQQRRALEAAREAEETASRQDYIPSHATAELTPETSAPPLGLVPPPPEAPQPNPLVVAALKRIERARVAPPPPVQRASRGGGAATAVARVAEEHYQTVVEPPVAPEVADESMLAAQVEHGAATEKIEKPVEVARASSLVIVPPALTTKAVETSDAPRATSRPHRHIPGVADESMLARFEAQTLAATLTAPVPESVPANDHASVMKRLAGGVIDLLVVAFASTPFAAIIELTNGNWQDIRVAASMGGIVCVLMFIYLMAATALAGRTWGMSLVSLRTVDAYTGLAPGPGQCARRAFAYMFSLATLGIGLLYALFDAEGRAAHDHLSGTIVVAD